MHITLIQYLFIDFIAVFFMYCADKSGKNQQGAKKKIYIFLSAAVLIIQLVFRDYSVGRDYQSYINLYLSAHYGYISNAWTGRLWIMLCKLFGIFFGSRFIYFFAFIGVATVALFYKSIIYENKYAFIGLAVYLAFCLYYQSFNQFRQMLAVAVVLYSWRYIRLKKMYIYFLWIGIAACFHASALVMLPIYFIADRDITFKNVMLYAVLCLVLIYGFDTIQGLLKNTSYGGYVDSGYDMEFGAGTILNTIVRCMMLFVCMIFKNRVIKNDESSKSLYNIAIVCTIVQILALFSHLFARISTYFFAFYILLIPKVAEAVLSRVKEKWIIYILIFAALLVYHNIYFFSTANSYGYDVYKFLGM